LFGRIEPLDEAKDILAAALRAPVQDDRFVQSQNAMVLFDRVDVERLNPAPPPFPPNLCIVS